MRSMHPAQTLRPISEKTAASRRRELANYWFIVPIFLLFATFIVYPIIYNFILSGYDWNGVSLTRKAVGLTADVAVETKERAVLIVGRDAEDDHRA